MKLYKLEAGNFEAFFGTPEEYLFKEML